MYNTKHFDTRGVVVCDCEDINTRGLKDINYVYSNKKVELYTNYYFIFLYCDKKLYY
jgi:hypothetical protein